jgi:hypothetical protein
MSLNLFVVKHGTKVVGEFENKILAKVARDELNGGAFGSDKSSDSHHVSRSKDHWRGLSGLVPATRPQGSRKNSKVEAKKGAKK